MNVELPTCLLEWIKLDNIHWDHLCKNPSEGAIQLLEKNQNKINWSRLCENPSEGAMWLLEKNQDKIDWHWLSQNLYIFKYDYIQMKQNRMLFKEDLIKNRFHPRNISKFRDWGINGFDNEYFFYKNEIIGVNI